MSGICSPTSFFNQRLPGGIAIDPNSATYMAQVVAMIEAAGHVGLEFNEWALTCWYAGSETPRQKVWLDEKDGESPKKREILESVPIPSELRPPGPFPGDNPVAIYQPSTDEYWELYGMRYHGVDATREVAGCTTLEEPGWHCANVGATKNFSQSPGYFTGTSWPGVEESKHLGISGSGIWVWPGVIKIAEAQRQYIPHAIRFELPTRQKTPNFRWPAQKTDGKSEDATMPMEGMIFTFKTHSEGGPDLTMIKDGFARSIAVAIRDFGAVLTDGAGVPSIKAESQRTIRGSQSMGTDAWDNILTAAPATLMAEIPFSQMVLVDAAYRPSPVAPGMLPAGV